MATEVLEAIIDNQTIPREVHHDLESFILVLFYAMYRRALINNPANDLLRAEFARYFGCTTLDGITSARVKLQIGQPQLRRCVSDRWNVMLLFASRLLHSQNAIESEIREDFKGKGYISKLKSPGGQRDSITYDNIFEMLDVVLKEVI